MKNILVLIVVLASVLMVGCKATRHLGNIDGVDVYAVETNDSLAPNTTTIISNIKGTQKLEVVNSASGPSNVGQVLAPVSGVAQSVIMGRSMEQAAKNLNGDNINVQGSSANANAKGGKAYSGSSSYSNSSSHSSSAASSASSANVNNNQSQTQTQSRW